MFKEFFRQREAQRLNRDAVAIIEADTHTHDQKYLAAIAAQLDSSLKVASQSSAERMMQVMKNSHRKARDERNQVNLSAATLAIIYLRAKELGEAAQPARDAVERFAGKYCPIAFVDGWEQEW